MAVSRGSCYVGDEDGHIVAIVPAPLGNGPIHVVLPTGDPVSGEAVSPGSHVVSTGARLLIGEELEIGVERAGLWDPKAYITAGAGGPELVRRALPSLKREVVAQAPPRSLARLLPHLDAEDLPRPLQGVPHFPRSHALMGGLVEALLRRNHRGLKVVTSSLAGFGPGLTPAGDDFLAGLLLALALTHLYRPDPEAAAAANLVLDTALPRTNEISATYLQAAHAGEAAEAWHPLLSALLRGEDTELPQLVSDVVAVDEPSGADMLAGFLAGLYAAHGLSPCGTGDAPLPTREASPPA